MRTTTVVKLAILFALVVTVSLWEGWPRRSGPPQPGAPRPPARAVAPDFTLQDLDGQPLVLSHYRGKVVLLDFWATWCTPCREEAPHFVAFQEKYREQGLQVLGISMDDDPQAVRGFYREFKLNYPVAMGTTQVAEAYGGVLGLPITFLVGRDGRIAAKYAGPVPMPALEQRIASLLHEK